MRSVDWWCQNGLGGPGTYLIRSKYRLIIRPIGRVRYVPGPPRPIWGYQSIEEAEIYQLVVSEWPGRSRNILNIAKNILNKAKNRKNLYFWDLTRLKMKKILFFEAKNFLETHPDPKYRVFKKRIFRPLRRLYGADSSICRFWPNFCQFLRTLLGLVWDNQAGLDRYGSMVLYRRNSCAQRAYLEAE